MYGGPRAEWEKTVRSVFLQAKEIHLRTAKEIAAAESESIQITNETIEAQAMKPHKFRVGERVRVVLEGWVEGTVLNNVCVRYRYKCTGSPMFNSAWFSIERVRPIPRRRKRSMASVVGTLGSSGHQTIDTRRRKKK